MEALTSELTKKSFKNWRSLFLPFMKENLVSQAERREDGLSCFLMGLYYEEGFVVQKDYQTALEYFRLGANKREPFCLYKLYEIHSGKNFFGIEPDKEIALLYLIWSVVYLLPVYGTYMCLDLDLEFQSYYKNVLKQNKAYVYELIDQFEDDIFAHDKEIICCVFDFLVNYVSPGAEFNAQEGYNQMIDGLIDIANKEDPRMPALFLFKCVLWDFQNVTNRNHQKVLDLMYKKNCTSFIFQNLKNVFSYLNEIHEKHAVFSKFLRFDGIEVFWQVRYNCNAEDTIDKDEAAKYVAQTLYDHLALIENNITRFISMDLIAKCYEDGIGLEKDLKKALEIIESSRNFPGFVEDDFPYMRIGRLYEKLGDTEISVKSYEKYIGYSHAKRDLPIKFFRQGKYYEHHKKDLKKAIEIYIKGLQRPTEFYTFQLEFYSRKCHRKIWKLIRAHKDLYDAYNAELETAGFFQNTPENCRLCE